MAKTKDLKGIVFGSLSVADQLPSDFYGGRYQTRWRCQCSCGESITLFYDQLPTTPLRMERMGHAGRRLYDCCERCRQKECEVCGKLFIYSKTSLACDECSKALYRQRDLDQRSQRTLRYQEDNEYRESVTAYNRTWHHANRQKKDT